MTGKISGQKKGHIMGSGVTGGHTTVVEEADKIVRRLGKMDWFESIEPLAIHGDRSVGGGQPFVAVSEYGDGKHCNTLSLTFKRVGAVQKMTLRVKDLAANREQILEDIESVVKREWRGSAFYNRLEEAEAVEEPVEEEKKPSGGVLLEKWSRNGDHRRR